MRSVAAENKGLASTVAFGAPYGRLGDAGWAQPAARGPERLCPVRNYFGARFLSRREPERCNLDRSTSAHGSQLTPQHYTEGARARERSEPLRDGHSPQDRNEIFLTPWLLRDVPAAQGHVMRRTP